MKLLAITSCPNGIAHTYMAAENLQKAADKLGIEMKVETQGSIGVENEFSEKDIEEADGIIIAADKTVEKGRFIGKNVLVVGVQDGIRRPEQLINKHQNGEVPILRSGGKSADENKKEKKDKQNPIYRHLMNGVSYMIPFIVVGGLLIAIALTIGGKPTESGLVIPEDSFWKTIEQLGGASFTFMIPILAGFIAYSIADRPGLAPGVIGGMIAGFLAGYVALAIKRIKVPKAVQPIMPIIIIPVFASLIVGLVFVFIVGAPVAQVFESLTSWLSGMQGTSSILLAVILGAMISFDMGGPVNKVAFLFGAAMIGEGNYEIMGPIIAAAICIPPIGMGLATFLKKRKYEEAERETGKASFTMGLFGITEGAIPFAAQDPIRVIPSIMAGSITGSVIAMMGNVGDRVAHGGPIVAVLGAIDNVLMFFLAVIVGAFVTAILVNLLKKDAVVEVAGLGMEISSEELEEEQPVQSMGQTQSSTTEITKLTDITNERLIDIELKGSNRDDVIDEMIAKLEKEGVLDSSKQFRDAIISRENESSTGIGMNIAIPHGKSSAVSEPRVVFGLKQEGIDWNSLDGTKARLIFMIAVPKESEGDAHLKILQMLSRQLMDDQFREKLLTVQSTKEAYHLLEQIK
jgi:fructose PTS system EIIBC or EIIC component